MKVKLHFYVSFFKNVINILSKNEMGIVKSKELCLNYLNRNGHFEILRSEYRDKEKARRHFYPNGDSIQCI